MWGPIPRAAALHDLCSLGTSMTVLVHVLAVSVVVDKLYCSKMYLKTRFPTSTRCSHEKCLNIGQNSQSFESHSIQNSTLLASYTSNYPPDMGRMQACIYVAPKLL